MEILENNVRKSAFSYHHATNANLFSWTIAIKLQKYCYESYKGNRNNVNKCNNLAMHMNKLFNLQSTC